MIARARFNVSRLVLLAACGYAAAYSAWAQEHWEPPGTPLPDYAKVYPVQPGHTGPALPGNDLPNIMVVGYWPPTNEMVRRFSTSPTQNPDGWIGENWEGRGFNIYAFFPEFPNGLGKGVGDFEVDYQHTSQDFWYYTAEVRPVALITFGRALSDRKWTLETRHRNRGVGGWANDYELPYQPTPCPPDNTMGVNALRYSSLPVEEIKTAVNNGGLNVTAVIDQYANAGNFLCEYIGYHACWYHALHSGAGGLPPNIAAGHIHAGSLITLPDAVAATEITLRTLEKYLHRQIVASGDMNCDGLVNLDDIDAFVLALSGQAAYQAAYPDCNWYNADCNYDGSVGFDDIDAFVALLGS